MASVIGVGIAHRVGNGTGEEEETAQPGENQHGQDSDNDAAEPPRRAPATHGMRARARSTVTRAVIMAMSAAATGSSASTTQCQGAKPRAGRSWMRPPEQRRAAPRPGRAP